MELTKRQEMWKGLNSLYSELPESIVNDIQKRVSDYCEPIFHLTNLQEELGYVKGEISTVAMLGLVGEAGEVLAETDVSLFNSKAAIILDAVNICTKVDDIKKLIRKREHFLELTISGNRMNAFKKELGDTFYYLNILATNVGLTIFDLAQMAHDKVRAKQADGGSSEDPKTS